MSKIILVDGSSYLFRAFHALPHLTNQHGEPTGAMYGVINMLKKLPSEYDTDYIAVIFDAKGKNFRHELYPEYKANRKPMADELRIQIAPVHELIEKMGYPLFIIDGVEADDVIGTMATELAAKGHEVLISTGDKDMAQLVSPKITLIDTMKNQLTDLAHVKQRFGVEASQIIDYLALVGDVSDNIPGVAKVGPKTAIKWLEQYHTLDGVMANAEHIGGKVGENLRDSLSFLPLSYQLATIKCDLELTIDAEALKMRKPDINYLKQAFSRYDFKTWLKALDNQITKKPMPIEPDYEIITDEPAFQKLCQKLKKVDLFAFDTETTALNTFDARLVGLSFSLYPGHGVYIPLTHDYEDAPKQLDLKYVLDHLKPIFSDETIDKIAHNAKYDLKILNKYDITVSGMKFDTMLESYVYNSAATKHNMDALAKKYLDIDTISFEDLAGKGKKQKTFNEIDILQAGHYSAEDADITYRLHHYFWPQIEAVSALKSLYFDEELPVCFVIDKMERIGVRIDANLLKSQSAYLTGEIAKLEKQCHELAGEIFNLSSPKQLQNILFDKLNLPVLKKTPGGQPSTAEEILQELSAAYELPALIIQHRHLSKLKSTYTDKLPQMIEPSTGRVHTSYHQAVAITGRLSSSDPNLQNIPVKSNIGREIRRAFIAQDGYGILAADYSQVELRIMAHLSDDKTLVEAFKHGLDIHAATAAETLGKPLDDVTQEERRRAKAINFGLIYGMSAFGLAKQLNISRGEAQDYVNIYFERYPGVKNYMDEIRKTADQQGFVETIFGRRLYLPDIKSRNIGLKRAAERAAINAPMQGSAADIIKRAMIAIDEWITRDKAPVKMIMQVHDELVFEVCKDYLDTASLQIKRLMQNAVLLSVPLVADIGSGSNWEEAH
ncbi:MAG: DNA polymerase I [Francisellaceae bacterium]